ncbi:MAG: 4Fe-4S binding protein [Victivallales bacterium]|nr:4Fe-4S binding protein [Victivallales bacterium]MCF7889374.1 4Fe-4S binding protein [Victivallales bacterium]
MNKEILKNILSQKDEKNINDSYIKDYILSNTRSKIKLPTVFLGTATCGLSAGANKVLTKLEEYIKNKDINLVKVGCIGLCAEEPIMDVQIPGRTRLTFKNVTESNAVDIIEAVLGHEIKTENFMGQHRNSNFEGWEGLAYLDEHPFFQRQTRLVLKNCGIIDPTNIDEYIAFGGYRAFTKVLREYKYKTPEVCNIIEESGLRGRGGGGFLTGRKWKFALNTESSQKYMICNADEGDPGAFMDRAVIEGDPHRLLEGLAIGAYAIGATKAYIYIRAEYPLAISRLETAIRQAKEYGLLGSNIMNTDFSLDIIIKKGAGAFVCGEETALIHSIEGKRGMPRPRPPFPAVKGLFGKPSVINNVETYANVPGIIDSGSAAFNSIGTKSSKGTKVFALSGRINRTGLVEVAMGTKLSEIVFEIGGGIPNDKNYKAVQIGGPSGGCIPTEFVDIEIDYESLKNVGAMMGSGGLVVMDESTCMVDLAKFFMDFIQRESCGKCIPCREGTRHMLGILEDITHGRKDESPTQALQRFKGLMYLERLAKVIQDTSLCGLGQTAPNPVLSTLKWFREEYEAHIYERKCPAGVCRDLINYKIIEANCVGCTACAQKCPTGAVKGAKRSPHYIVTDLCIGCGACIETCKFDAIVID